MSNQIKLLVLDIDGVMTNGTKVYDYDHSVLSKSYNDKDFTAIKIFKRLGIDVCFLSSDESINSGMAESRGVDFFYSRNDDGSISKSKYLPTLEEKYGVERDEIVYVGDDLFDLDIMMELPLMNRVCPSDAPKYMREKCGIVLTRSGGTGAVAEYLEIVAAQNDIDVCEVMMDAIGSIG